MNKPESSDSFGEQYVSETVLRLQELISPQLLRHILIVEIIFIFEQ